MKFLGVLRPIESRLRGVRTCALIGRSGTGKSFRAHLIAEKHDVDIIIDDGLIIAQRAILYGRSSKSDHDLLSAVRHALFEETGQCREARRCLQATGFRRALIVGTSTEMVNRIAHNLRLPRPTEVFDIRDLATGEELAAARRKRRRGAHSLPLPPVTVKLGPWRSLSGKMQMIAGAVSALRHHRPLPPFATPAVEALRKGGVILGQMVQHCVQEHDSQLSLGRLTITRRGALHSIEIRLTVPYGRAYAGSLHTLR
jgi:hypothetical protein